MPKLRGEKHVYENREVDKENDDVIYSDKDHIYLGKKDKVRYTSVTQLIHEFTQPFDSAFWSAYKTCEFMMEPEEFYKVKQSLLKNKVWKDSFIDKLGLDKKVFDKKRAEILQGYEDKKNTACDRGTKIHAQMEDSFYQGDRKTIRKYTGGGNIKVEKGYYRLDLDRAIYPEFLISYSFDEYLKIAGQVDLLVKDGNDITILDWKTNEKIDKESYYDRNTKKHQTMKFPLDNIQDCNFYHYTLQLSLYAYLLQKINPKFKINKLAIVHFDHEGNETEYECEYLKDDVARMLLYYRRQQKVRTELEKDKPIIF
jgi:hypothetical protein